MRIALLLTLCILVGCAADDGTRTIADNVGFLPCYASEQSWYNALVYRQNFGAFPSDDTMRQTAYFMAGDRVRIVEDRNVDEVPALVSVTGAVMKLQALSGPYNGKTCWVYTGSVTNGPMFN